MRRRAAAPTVQPASPSRRLAALPATALALLLTGCATREPVPMATHGLARLAYKQVVAVSRAAESHGTGFTIVYDDADPPDPLPDVVPAQRTDVPPGSWVAAFPAPDPEPPPSAPPVAPTVAAPEPEAAAPEPVAREAPEPRAVEPFEPRPVEVPPAYDTGPDVVVFVPGARPGEAAQAPVQASPGPPNVTVVVVAPVVAIGGHPGGRAPASQHVAARPAIHTGLGRPAFGRR